MLGLGNALLGDDGVGLKLLSELSRVGQVTDLPDVEFLDGGTQGLALLMQMQRNARLSRVRV